jgi:N,N-dimethylformamidase beta subunit-like protein
MMHLARIFLVAVLAFPAFAITIPAATALAADNPIVAENGRTGSTGWRMTGPSSNDATGQIKGYASRASVRQGESITLNVSVNPAQTYTVNVFRMGWYGGAGGRLRYTSGTLDGVTQPECPPDPTTGMIACAWAPGVTLSVPADWTTGVYLALLTNADGYQNYVMFTVRDDRPAAFLYQQAVITDQAYNNWPDDGRTGKSLYGYNSYGANTIAGDTRAVKVSFDRPYTGNGSGLFFQWDIYLIRWMERSGYDMTYSTNIETHANGASLRNHKAFLSSGHDEYWSWEMFDAAEAARDAGVGLAFFGADSVTVQVRMESSAGSVPNRVVVCYKNPEIDPDTSSRSTGAFRWAPVNRPEQSLLGIQDPLVHPGWGRNVPYVVANSSHWIYAGTGLKDGDSIPGLVGYEVHRFMSGYPAPNSTKFTLLSQSPYTSPDGIAGVANSSIYQAPSGAWVFASGTMSWSWGLDNFDVSLADARIQQVTANLFNAFLNGAPRYADHLKVTAPATVNAGQSFSVTVSAEDAQGPVPTYAGTVHFASADAGAGVVLPADSTLPNGQKTFSVTLATPGSQTITVSDAANTLSATVNLTVARAAANHLVLATAATPTAGASFTFTVSAQDQFGNVDTAYAGRVHFTSSDSSSGVVLPADATLTNGLGSFNATLTKAGAQTITATDTTTSSIAGTMTANVRAAPASRLVLSSSAAPTAGTSFGFTVRAQDQFGNVDLAYAGRVHFTSSDSSSGVVLPADATLSNGQGSFNATLTKAGAQTITGTDTASATVTGAVSVSVKPAAAAAMSIAAPASTKMNQSFNFTVTLRDRFGNVATGYTGTVRFSTTDISPLVNLPANYTFTAGDAGVHTFSATLQTPPSQTITASDIANEALTATSTSIAVNLPLL